LSAAKLEGIGAGEAEHWMTRGNQFFTITEPTNPAAPVTKIPILKLLSLFVD
jgi:hypothetical protein